MTQARVGWRSFVTSVVNAVDADAQAFISAAGITDLTQAAAINTLVNDLKTYGIWTKMKAIYPFVGGSATSHKFNLKDPRDLDAAFRLVFNGGWTHASTGAKPNGTTGYANTFYNPSSNLTPFLGYYSITNGNTGTDQIDMGSSDLSKWTWLSAWYKAGIYNNILARNSDSSVLLDGGIQADSRGWYWTNKVSTNAKLGKNGNVLTSSADSTIAGSVNIAIGAMGSPSGANYYSNRETAFSVIADGMSDTDTTNLYTSIQKFQTTLGRHVGTPYVSDADAVSFLTVAGITDGNQAVAINTLVIDLKAVGIWTKMKAIYPFVGGTATSHKFNLKDPRDLDAAYRLVFNGGWTHSSTGALPNGTTAYADTKLVPSSILTLGSFHHSTYSRTTWSVSAIMGGCNDNNSPQRYLLMSNPNGTTLGNIIFNTSLSPFTSPINNTRGLMMGNRISTTTVNAWKDGVKVLIDSSNGVTERPTINYYIGARNNELVASGFDNKETAFYSIGDGLTDAESAAFYTAVQTFQTTLGRQVSVPLVSDTNAQAFLNAANITSFQQASAVNTLVTDLKAAGIWTKMKALYPFVGGSATSHKWNLKDPRDLDAAYRLVFNGGWTHTSSGAQPNGTTGYANTFLNPVNFAIASGLGVYSTTNSSISSTDVGALSYFPVRAFQIAHNSTTTFGGVNSDDFVSFADTDTRGFYQSYRTDSNTVKTLKDTTSYSRSLAYYPVNLICLIGGRSENGAVSDLSSRNLSIVYFQENFNDTDALTMRTIVQKFQTALGRQVGTPVYNTNGLVLNLDAGNANSYPGTGTTWFDLAAGNNGTLVNGPTYDSTNGGSILFDGVNDYVNLGSNFRFNDTDITYDFWVKVTDNSDVYHEIITLGSSNQTNSISLWKFRSGSNSGKVFANINVVGFTQTWVSSQLTGADILNTIVNYTAVFKKESGVYKIYLYRNGVLDGSTTSNITSYNMNNWSNFEARIGSGSSVFPELWKGNIYSGKVYNRSLSATEVLQNFNSSRGRFGL